MFTEHVIRYVDLKRSQQRRLWVAKTVEDGRQVEPPRICYPTWLAITHVLHSNRESYIVYFLSADGRMIDLAQRRTLDDAITEVGLVVDPKAWHECSLALYEDWERIPREAITKEVRLSFAAIKKRLGNLFS